MIDSNIELYVPHLFCTQILWMTTCTDDFTLSDHKPCCIYKYLVLINPAGGLYERSLTEVTRTYRTSDRGQDSPTQTDLARLISCLLYGQTRNKKDKKNHFISSPARAQAFSWLTSVTSLQSSQVQTG